MLSNYQRGSALEDTYKSCRGVPYCNMTGMHAQILHKNTSDLGDSRADARVPFVWWGSREWERTAVLRRQKRWWSRACTSLWQGFCVMSLLIFSHNFLFEKKKVFLFVFSNVRQILGSPWSIKVLSKSRDFHLWNTVWMVLLTALSWSQSFLCTHAGTSSPRARHSSLRVPSSRKAPLKLSEVPLWESYYAVSQNSLAYPTIEYFWQG